MLLASAPLARAEEPPPPPPARGEKPAPAYTPWSLDLTVDDFGIGIGNSKHVDGLRLNFRDVAPFTVHGINLTLWMPAERGGGDVIGLALGIPVTGAATLRGLGVGLLGLVITDELDGVGIAGLGLGSGKSLRGIFVGGLGVGSGGDIDGLAIGGLGIGAKHMRGVVVGGLGIGAGGSIEGLAVAGLGIGSPRIRGVVAALAAGGQDVAGAVIAPAFFDLMPDGKITGVSVSAFNRIRGDQRGLAIGIVNYARWLHGVQIGLVNIAGNNPSGLKVLPIVNAHLD